MDKKLQLLKQIFIDDLAYSTSAQWGRTLVDIFTMHLHAKPLQITGLLHNEFH